MHFKLDSLRLFKDTMISMDHPKDYKNKTDKLHILSSTRLYCDENRVITVEIILRKQGLCVSGPKLAANMHNSSSIQQSL